MACSQLSEGPNNKRLLLLPTAAAAPRINKVTLPPTMFFIFSGHVHYCVLLVNLSSLGWWTFNVS